VDERHYFLNKKFCVAVGAAATEARRFSGRVFANTDFSDVVNSNDDERLNGAGENEIVSGVADVPIHSGNERGGAIEKILAVVHVQNGKAALRLLVIARWKINDEMALIAEET
jgi:hypothetical protein